MMAVRPTFTIHLINHAADLIRQDKTIFQEDRMARWDHRPSAPNEAIKMKKLYSKSPFGPRQT